MPDISGNFIESSGVYSGPIGIATQNKPKLSKSEWMALYQKQVDAYTPACPKCGARQVRFTAANKIGICTVCGKTWKVQKKKLKKLKAKKGGKNE